MKTLLHLALAAVTLVCIVPLASSHSNPMAGGSTFTATGEGDGSKTVGDPTFELHQPGSMTVTSVKVNGVTLTKDTDYTLTDNNSSQVKVNFNSAPANGASVEIKGTYTNDNHGPYSGAISWS